MNSWSAKHETISLRCPVIPNCQVEITETPGFAKLVQKLRDHML